MFPGVPHPPSHERPANLWGTHAVIEYLNPNPHETERNPRQAGEPEAIYETISSVYSPRLAGGPGIQIPLGLE